MRLAWTVIRILPENDDFDLFKWRGVQGIEDISATRIDFFAFAFSLRRNRVGRACLGVADNRRTRDFQEASSWILVSGMLFYLEPQ